MVGRCLGLSDDRRGREGLLVNYGGGVGKGEDG